MTVMMMMMMVIRRSDSIPINPIHGGGMQAQHQAYSPPICLQVVLMVYADGLGRGDGLLYLLCVFCLLWTCSVSFFFCLLKQVAIIIYIL